MLSLLEFLHCFSRVLKVTIAGSNPSIGMENNDELYGVSAVKVKLVASLMWRPFILRISAEFACGSDDKIDLTRASFYFEQFVL